MCLAIPAQIVELVEGYGDQLALADVLGARRRINIGMLDEVPSPGDWVLIHMGLAVERIDEGRAEEALAGLETIGRAREVVDAG